MLFRSNILRSFSQFVPNHISPDSSDLENFKLFITHYRNILVLTGAGVSTESGIPDYRSEDVGVFARTNYKPIQYPDFLKNPESRRRFWARNFVAWPRFSSFAPNRIHWFISSLEMYANKMSGLITQNVDGLHSKAGSQNVVELHGNAFWVRCLNCGDTISRFDYQRELQKLNSFMKNSTSEIRPDGDVELNEASRQSAILISLMPDFSNKYSTFMYNLDSSFFSWEEVKNFQVIDCGKCGGILKPTIVFFGENVPQNRIKKVENLVKASDALLILGTSLSTLSSYRIVEQAFDLCKFICLVNIGPTRCDKMADLQICAKISDVIPNVKIYG